MNLTSTAQVKEGLSASALQAKVARSCTVCGATSTPQWREGPLGPKTLCNACGVKQMRAAKKRGDTSGRRHGGQRPSALHPKARNASFKAAPGVARRPNNHTDTDPSTEDEPYNEDASWARAPLQLDSQQLAGHHPSRVWQPQSLPSVGWHTACVLPPTTLGAQARAGQDSSFQALPDDDDEAVQELLEFAVLAAGSSASEDNGGDDTWMVGAHHLGLQAKHEDGDWQGERGVRRSGRARQVSSRIRELADTVDPEQHLGRKRRTDPSALWPLPFSTWTSLRNSPCKRVEVGGVSPFPYPQQLGGPAQQGSEVSGGSATRPQGLSMLGITPLSLPVPSLKPSSALPPAGAELGLTSLRGAELALARHSQAQTGDMDLGQPSSQTLGSLLGLWETRGLAAHSATAASLPLPSLPLPQPQPQARSAAASSRLPPSAATTGPQHPSTASVPQHPSALNDEMDSGCEDSLAAPAALLGPLPLAQLSARQRAQLAAMQEAVRSACGLVAEAESAKKMTHKALLNSQEVAKAAKSKLDTELQRLQKELERTCGQGIAPGTAFLHSLLSQPLAQPITPMGDHPMGMQFVYHAPRQHTAHS